MAHTNSGYRSAIKKNGIVPGAVTEVDPESVMLSEILQTEKETERMTSLTGGL